MRGCRVSAGQPSQRVTSIFTTSPGQFLALVIGIALILRIGWNLIVHVRPVSDFLWYFERATWLASGSGYITAEGLPTAYFPVGYPAFLAALFAGFGVSVVAVQAANIVLSAITIWIVYRLSERMLGAEIPRGDRVSGDRVSRVAVLLLALFPSQILYTSLASDSVLFQFLLCLGLLVLMAARIGWARLAVGGMIFGLATLTRPYAVLVPGVVLACRGGRDRVFVQARRLIVVYAAVVMVLAPWMIRNARSVGGAVPVSTNGGVNLLIGNGPGATGGFTEAPFARLREAGLSEYQTDRLAWRLGAEAVLSDPLRFFRLAPRKIMHMFADDSQALRWNLKGIRPRTSAAGYSPLEVAGMGAVQVYYTLAVLGSLAFLVLAARRRLFHREVSAVGYWIAAAFTATAIIFFGDPRFHFPLTPLLCFYAACFWELFRNRPAPYNRRLGSTSDSRRSTDR
jgi:hypothetical protein